MGESESHPSRGIIYISCFSNFTNLAQTLQTAALLDPERMHPRLKIDILLIYERTQS